MFCNGNVQGIGELPLKRNRGNPRVFLEVFRYLLLVHIKKRRAFGNGHQLLNVFVGNVIGGINGNVGDGKYGRIL